MNNKQLIPKNFKYINGNIVDINLISKIRIARETSHDYINDTSRVTGVIYYIIADMIVGDNLKLGSYNSEKEAEEDMKKIYSDLKD